MIHTITKQIYDDFSKRHLRNISIKEYKLISLDISEVDVKLLISGGPEVHLCFVSTDERLGYRAELTLWRGVKNDDLIEAQRACGMFNSRSRFIKMYIDEFNDIIGEYEPSGVLSVRNVIESAFEIYNEGNDLITTMYHFFDEAVHGEEINLEATLEFPVAEKDNDRYLF